MVHKGSEGTTESSEQPEFSYQLQAGETDQVEGSVIIPDESHKVADLHESTGDQMTWLNEIAGIGIALSASHFATIKETESAGELSEDHSPTTPPLYVASETVSELVSHENDVSAKAVDPQAPDYNTDVKESAFGSRTNVSDSVDSAVEVEKLKSEMKMIETPTPRKCNQQRREVILDKLIWDIQLENLLATKWTAAKGLGLKTMIVNMSCDTPDQNPTKNPRTSPSPLLSPLRIPEQKKRSKLWVRQSPLSIIEIQKWRDRISLSYLNSKPKMVTALVFCYKFPRFVWFLNAEFIGNWCVPCALGDLCPSSVP
ncbi:hypothetical protein AAG906_004722 [Vitis piasezkii]